MTKDQKEFAKQLHHLIRLYDCLNADSTIYRYNDKQRELMLDIKRGRYPSTLPEAEALKNQYVEKLNTIYEDRKLRYIEQPVDYHTIDKIVIDYLIPTHKEQQCNN